MIYDTVMFLHTFYIYCYVFLHLVLTNVLLHCYFKILHHWLQFQWCQSNNLFRQH